MVASTVADIVAVAGAVVVGPSVDSVAVVVAVVVADMERYHSLVSDTAGCSQYSGADLLNRRRWSQ